MRRLFTLRSVLGAIAGSLAGVAFARAYSNDYRTALILLSIDVFILIFAIGQAWGGEEK